jgi:hypothetical protein
MSPIGKARLGEGASVEGRSDCDQADHVCGEGIVTSDEWDEDYDPLYECEHENATFDILTGELSCSCGYRRYLLSDEFKREAQREAEMMDAYYRECEQTELDAKAAT